MENRLGYTTFKNDKIAEDYDHYLNHKDGIDALDHYFAAIVQELGPMIENQRDALKYELDESNNKLENAQKTIKFLLKIINSEFEGLELKYKEY